LTLSRLSRESIYRLRHISRLLSLREVFVLGCIWVFFASNLVLWEEWNKRLFAYDEVGHFFNSVAVAGIIPHPWVLFDFSQYLSRLASEHAMLFSFQLYPPFVYVVTSLFYFIWPPSLPLAASSNIVFLLVLEVSTYALAKHFYGRIAGVAAAFLVSAYPILVGISRTYLLEFALTATVSISLYLLAREHVLESKRTAFLLALSLAVGMLTKESFLFYVAGPVIYVFVKNSRDRVALKNAMLVILIASTSVVYYVIKPGGILAYLVYQSIPQQRGVAYVPPIAAWSTELEVMFRGLGTPLLVLFVAGGAVALIYSGYRMFTIIGLLTPIVLLGLFEPYYFDTRFTAPVLPLVAVTSVALFIRRPRRMQIIGVGMVALIVLTQYASLTYNSPVLSGLSVLAEPSNRGITSPPSTDDWMIARIVADMKQDASQRFLAHPYIVVLSSMAYFDQTLFIYYAYMENVNLAVMDNGYLSTPAGINSVCRANYVVDRYHINPGDVRSSGPEANMAGVSRFVESNLDHFESIGTYSLPDGSVASLYYRTLSCSNITLSVSSHFDSEARIQVNFTIRSNVPPMNSAI
jgi:hypothetical protein